MGKREAFTPIFKTPHQFYLLSNAIYTRSPSFNASEAEVRHANPVGPGGEHQVALERRNNVRPHVSSSQFAGASVSGMLGVSGTELLVVACPVIA
jgi:hypothetical protein